MRNAERGNVLFYILIAVGLLAALSYAVSSASRGNLSKLKEDKARLLASEIIEYGNTIASGVAQLRLRGVPAGSLCFDDTHWPVSEDYDHAGCTDNANKIFNNEGAGVVFTPPPAEAMLTSAAPDNLWHIYGENEIQEVGQTCGGAGCAELLLVVDELDEQVCLQINDFLNVDNSGGTPPVDTNINVTLFQGSFGYSQTIGDEPGSADLAGKTAGCFRKSAAPAKYTYYKVLLAR